MRAGISSNDEVDRRLAAYSSISFDIGDKASLERRQKSRPRVTTLKKNDIIAAC